MMTVSAIKRASRARHLIAQVSVHGAYRGSIQIFRPGDTRARIDVDTQTTKWGGGGHDIDRADLLALFVNAC